MKTITTIWTLAFLVAVAAAHAGPEDVRFSGGSYDGWDRYAMAASAGLGGALVSLSSGTHQVFDFTAANPTLAHLTIWAEDPSGTITNGGTMRISVPAAWACRFNTGASVSFSGSAAGKVGASTYTDGGRTLSIAVTDSFVADDTLIVSGLRLEDLRLVPADTKSLELDFDGDGARNVFDMYALTVRALWPGGSYDGWDRDAMVASLSLEPVPTGTTILLR